MVSVGIRRVVRRGVRSRARSVACLRVPGPTNLSATPPLAGKRVVQADRKGNGASLFRQEWTSRTSHHDVAISRDCVKHRRHLLRLPALMHTLAQARPDSDRTVGRPLADGRGSVPEMGEGLTSRRAGSGPVPAVRREPLPRHRPAGGRRFAHFRGRTRRKCAPRTTGWLSDRAWSSKSPPTAWAI